ncbi:N-acetyltransferase [Waterburya agarophytonicola K14]|uniref:N-acetyltransferase n=1 Tax=Waterburya agarophytonicola KI4 TaxID=2874699 RepID=A0A964BNR1_9CYAN|nr:GNAT family N-acetyltransferase [Waterburya agarophytonicola]MCC0175532.1 N-acetyltransferase [Waterburya agarophytonicola KI4]
MYVRDAKEADLTAIVDIYNQSIPSARATADTEPVTVDSRLNWYRNRSKNRPLWVAINKTEIVGWLSFQNFYGRPAYLHTAEISIYVATAYHHQGIGRELLAKAISFCPEVELTTLLGFVFAHNQPSINLFTRYGFSQWGYLPDVAVLDRGDKLEGNTALSSLLILGLSIN